MEVYKKIVVPYDGSTHSQLALEHAAFLAKLSGGTISVLYVASLTSAATRISGFFGNYDAGAVADRVHCHGLTRSGNLCRCSFRFGQHVCTGTYEDSGHCCKISLLRFRSAA